VSLVVREADPAELEDWDRRTVDVPGGHVLQSLAWARHRAGTGWHPHHLVLGDGRAVLALRRSWPVVGGGRAYLPRGPVTAGDPVEQVADRLAAVTRWLADLGVDAVTTDAEIPASSSYGTQLIRLGFRPVEEIEPARHRVSLSIDGVGEEELLARVAKPTRQRIRHAEAAGLVVRRFDVRAGDGPGPGFRAGPGGDLATALTAFHGLVRGTGERRGFRLGPLEPFLSWLSAAHAAGHAVYLEATLPAREGELASPIAGLLLYRHGDRLTTSISGDEVTARAEHPGVLHLLRWRAIQLAAREGCAEMDLGGVDVPGARSEPRQGDAMFGLYQHKRSFGAVFVEQVGAHERVLRPIHLADARAAGLLAGRRP
jgi:lipid II:glycine glycyltransferase (peptidoglycan interpeptide bridge formation enzyme)